MVENVVLKWDTFNSNLADLFKDLISSKTFSDLTLFSDDGVKFTAHKILLSSFSPVFRNMLEINSNQTIIYLRGIQSREFQQILQFMYTGEAVIEKDNMEEFLNVAKSLQVKNLCNNLQTVHCKKDEETIQEFASREGVFRRKYLCKFCDYRPSKRQHLIFHYKNAHKSKLKNVDEKLELDEIYQCLDCNFESVTLAHIQAHSKDAHDKSNTLYKSSEDIERNKKSIKKGNKTKRPENENHNDTIGIVDLLYKGVPESDLEEMIDFGFQAPIEDILKSHKIEHEQRSTNHECTQCKASFQDAIALSKHMKVHAIEKYPCPLCDLWTSKTCLQNHIKAKHESNKKEADQTKLKQSHEKSKIPKSKLKTFVPKAGSEVQGVRYPCSNCDYQASQLTDLVSHRESMHLRRNENV